MTGGVRGTHAGCTAGKGLRRCRRTRDDGPACDERRRCARSGDSGISGDGRIGTPYCGPIQHTNH